jgi:hypothetical protein
MFSTVFLICGIATSAAAAADLLLSDAQKQSIADLVVSLWNWLDEAKRLHFLNWLRQTRLQLLYTLGANIILSIGLSVYFWMEIDPYKMQAGWHVPVELWFKVIGIVVMVFVFGFAGMFAINRTLRATTATKIAVRAVGFSAVGILPAMAMMYWLLNSDVCCSFDEESLIVFYSFVNFAISITATFVLIIVFPLVSVYLTSTALFAGKFIVRRIAESPKGPVIFEILFGT